MHTWLHSVLVKVSDPDFAKDVVIDTKIPRKALGIASKYHLCKIQILL